MQHCQVERIISIFKMVLGGRNLGRQKKIKLIFSLLFIIFGTMANVYFSTFLHQILSNKTIQISFLSLNLSSFLDCIKGLKTNNNHFMLFVSFEILIMLSGLFFLFLNDKPYQSDLIKVTPDISIPVPAGQKQFGSARFMTEKEKLKAFPICTLNKNDKLINYLMKHGYDDLYENKDDDKDGDKDNE